MFLFKKMVGPLLLPHSLFLGVLVLGVVWMWVSPRRRIGKILVTLAAAGLVLLSYPELWSPLIRNMERRYTPLDLSRPQPELSQIRWIVVLGGGGAIDKALPATSQLSLPSVARLVEGIRILQAAPQAKLLVSGDPEAGMMQHAAEMLGIKRDRIVLEPYSRDTESEAVNVKELVGQDRFVLVTSALHMPRSMALFAKQGMTPLAAPADFAEKDGDLAIYDVLPPGANGGVRADALAHEWLGIWWARLIGRI